MLALTVVLYSCVSNINMIFSFQAGCICMCILIMEGLHSQMAMKLRINKNVSETSGKTLSIFSKKIYHNYFQMWFAYWLKVSLRRNKIHVVI